MQGAQRPRVSYHPPYKRTHGPKAIELCARAGLYLDDWQQLVLIHALGERDDGKWAAFEVGLTVPRQNGKGGILEARSLAGLFLLGERLVVHSAHEFKTAKEGMRRIEALIRAVPDLHRRVKKYSHSHGEEGIELHTDQRILFETRTKGGGRGFTADCRFYDEDMILQESAIGATLPTLSAVPNPQTWYTGSAVDQEVHEYGVVKARIRDRGLRGDDPSLAYFEWSPELDHPDDVTDRMATDPEMWAESNPALEIRISTEHVEREQRSMDARTFAVERLNVGDWPDPEGESKLIPNWDELADAASRIDGRYEFAFDVAPDRGSAAISAAGPRRDGLSHVEVVEHKAGTGWLVDRLVALHEKHGAPVACDDRGPAASFVQGLNERGVRVETLNASEYTQACGHFYDACGVEENDEATLRHLGTTELSRAVKGARQRPLGDAWAWSRKNSNVDITTLVSCTLALWRARRHRPSNEVKQVQNRELPGVGPVTRRAGLTLRGERYVDRDRRG